MHLHPADEHEEPEDTTRLRASSILVMVLVIAVTSMLAPPRSASAEAPLPRGVYEVQLGSRLVTIEADDDGTDLRVPEDVIVRLSFDDEGRVLNQATIRTPTGSFDVEIDTFEAGAYRVRVDEQQNVRVDLADDPVTRTVAACTPSGLVAATIGLPNHGTTVSHAASGMDTTYTVDNPVDDTIATVSADFRTLDGARTYCDTVALVAPTPQEIRAFVAEGRARALDPAAARAAEEAADRVDADG